VTIQATHLAFEVVKGCKDDPNNALSWDRVILNLPGQPDYNPAFPWVYRVRRDGTVAGATPAFVDDLRPVGSSKEHCFSVLHQTASRFGYLGMQIASRKTRPPTQSPGAWAGVIAAASTAGISVQTSQEKWEKERFLLELEDEMQRSQTLDYKPLEQKRGFLVHLQRVYPAITPFLKGLHLTLDGWRPGRDTELWKIQGPQLCQEGIWDDSTDSWMPVTQDMLSPPSKVTPAPRLAQDLVCLRQLFSLPSPPPRFIRASNITMCVYGFVDASGSGFGSSFQLPEGSILFRHGLWGRDADHTSSNYKELRNLVEALEAGVQSGDLDRTEIFLFTDNSTAEGAYYKGNSSSKLLFELVLCLRLLDMHGGIILHVIHVAGTRMMKQGTDGLSRGDFSMGVMSGQQMLSFIPINLSAMDRAPLLLAWIRSWLPDSSINPLCPAEWYDRGHGLKGGTCNSDGLWVPTESNETWFLWTPPPAAAAVALHEFGLSWHKRPHLNHLVVCPRLMTQLWRKRLHKLVDLVIEIPAGSRQFWPLSMHEPLLLGLTLSFVPFPPWQLRQSSHLLELARQLQVVWKDPLVDERPILHQLCALPRMLAPVP
jgi:hypothetical protein